MKAQHILMLTTFLLAHPDATTFECKAFIYCNTTNNLVVGEMTIRRALSLIGFSRKIVSHTATQAFAPINVQLSFNFWTMPFPYGIVNTPRSRIIDSDECGFQLSDINRKYGYSVSGVKINTKGNYSKSTKITLIASIEAGDPNLPPHVRGSRENPRIWFRINVKLGTTIKDYRSYIESLMDSLPNNEPQRTFIHDNLSSHVHQSVRDAIHERGHRVVRRPPYYPSDAPIEYFFNTLASRICSNGGYVSNVGALIQLVTNALNEMTTTNGYFDHCGYPV